MQLDLFYELAVPPGVGISEAAVYHDTLAQIEAGDRMGFGCAWLVEHHFTPGYSHCSKPELVLAAAAMRTRRMRLGHAIVPLPLHHPLHVAERVATLDILTAGRLEVGIGRGFSPAEYAAFGLEIGESRARTAEALAVLRRSFGAGPVEFAGQHYRVERTEVLPKCVQRPHPPLWTAAVSPNTFDWAADERLGVLVGPFKPWFMVEADLRRFRARATTPCPPVGHTIGIVCLEDAARARRLAREAFVWVYRELLRLTSPVLERLYPGYEELHALGRFRHLLKLGVDLGFLETFGLAVVGTPDHCVDRLRTLGAAGVDRVLLSVGAGCLSQETALESMQLIADRVMPALA